MQPLDHGLEFDAGAGARGVARLRGEIGERVVAPIVPEPLLDEAPVVDEGVHRQQLDRGDPEVDQIVDHRRRAEAGVGAAQPDRQIGMAFGQAADVGLVDQGLGPGHPRAAIAAPGECRVDDAAFGHRARVVPAVERQIPARAADPVAEMGIGPAQRAVQDPGVGVDQQLVGIEAMAAARLVGAVHPVAVQLARRDLG
jgi:hypothetical protein